MKTKLILFTVLGLAVASHAVLIDGYESYTLGTAEAAGSDAFAGNGGPWGVQASWLPGIKIEQEAGPNNYLAVGGGSEKGVWRDLGSNGIADGSTGIVYYQVGSKALTADYSIGLSDEAAVTTWGTLEAYVNLKGDGTNLWLGARNTDSTVIVATGLSVDTWYDVWLVVDNAADTYDVYYGTGLGVNGMGSATLVADDFVFRNSGAGAAANDLGTFGMYGWLTADDAVEVDNIHVIPEPATLGLVGIFGAGILIARRRFRI